MQNGVKMSFTQNFFHPSGLPAGGQYTNVYGTKGAVSLDNGKFYPLERGKAACCPQHSGAGR